MGFTAKIFQKKFFSFLTTSLKILCSRPGMNMITQGMLNHDGGRRDHKNQ
jgi:hypothetical protein